MKAQILKIAGVKSEKEFYKKFPTEESFMKVHGKALKKAQMGTMIQGSTSPQFNPQPINFQQLYDQNDMFITGSTQDMRDQEALDLANLEAQQKMANKKSGLVETLTKLGTAMGGGAKNGKKLKKAATGQQILGGISKGIGKAGGPAAVAQNVGNIVGGIQQMRDEKNIMKEAQQMAGVSDVALQASMTRPEQIQKKYVRPEDNINTGSEFFPIYGTGTVISRNGTEIANTFAPNTLYTDLETAQNGVSKYMEEKKWEEKDKNISQKYDLPEVVVSAPYLTKYNDPDKLTGYPQYIPKPGDNVNSPGWDIAEFYKSWVSSPEYERRMKNTGYYERPPGGDSIYGKGHPVVRLSSNQYLENARNSRMGALEATQEPGFVKTEPAYYKGRRASLYTPFGISIDPLQAETPEMYKNVLAHEIAHAIDSSSDPERMLIYDTMLTGDAFDQPQFYAGVNPDTGRPWTDAKSRIRRAQAIHVRDPDEFKSDLNALRYFMFDKGIFDIREGKEFTKEDLEKAKEVLKGNPSLERSLDAAGESGFIKLMNVIAKGKEDVTPVAAGGGSFFSNLGDPNFLQKNKTTGQQTFISKFQEQGGGDALSQLTSGIGNPKGYGPSGASKLGGGVGSTLGTIVGGPVGGMIGDVLGRTVGNVLDRKAEKTQQARDVTDRNITSMAFNQGTQGLQQQNYAFMRDGGMANPQVATSLEGIPLTRLFAPDPTMDVLRAGGHLKSYTPPSERAMYTGRDQFAMGGNLETHWGGYAEPMSYNPYLPDGGETVMFRGKSHEESDGKGNTGIGITYGDSPVEVERGEPAVQLKNGTDGDNSLTVYGNLKIPSFGASLIGDNKAKGKKFKNYVADLSKTEQKQNKIVEKSTEKLDSLEVNTPQDLLAFESYKANILGANMKLKDIAKKKQDLASLQSAINDTAEEYGFEADALAKGKVKQAKKGTSIAKAQPGGTYEDISDKIYRDALALEPLFIEEVDPSMNLDEVTVNASKLPPTIQELRDRKLTPGNYPQYIYANTPVQKTEGKIDWMTLLNQVIPYLRPSNALPLDPRQLSGEMLALATNQVDPVQMQTIQPQLNVPFDISLQEIINENEADYRAAQRMMGYSPAALAALNAQKYQANQKVLGEQFKLNQAMKDKVYAENRNLLNQANLSNLQAFDQQYVRQQGALSNTKATAQAALNSIASKYLQNQSENRTLQTYENLYNYRFDPRFRAMNMNPLAQFTTDMLSNMTPEQVKELVLKATKATEGKKNGGIVKAIKSM
jgi:hypothetical protein